MRSVRRRFIRTASGLGAGFVLTTALVACSVPVPPAPSGNRAFTPAGSVEIPEFLSPPVLTGGQFRQAAQANRAYVVDGRFVAGGPTVLADADGSGVEVSRYFFTKSPTAVIVAGSTGDILKGAALAINHRAPLLQLSGENAPLVTAELDRLGVTDVYVVGSLTAADVPVPDDRQVTVHVDDGTDTWMTDNLPTTATQSWLDTDTDLNAALAKLRPGEAVWLRPSWELSPQVEQPAIALAAETIATSGGAPITVATEETSIAAVVSAIAAGAPVRILSHADPRLNPVDMQQVAGLSAGPVVGLGSQFGSGEWLSSVIAMGESGQQPVLPGQMFVALYGHPSGDALGALGEQNPQEAARRVQELAATYQILTEIPVTPAFEIIATVASGGPGDDGNYSNESTVEELTGYVDAITAVGGYVVLDLQPGRARFLDQARLYEPLLLRPNVGLALDPEWMIGPEQEPLEDIGQTSAAEVNEVADWLAGLVKQHHLPQKVFILHQFNLSMLPDRDQIRVDRPELATVLHADGSGSWDDKLGTWNTLREGLNPMVMMGWKNFYDEDSPVFTPEQTLSEVSPTPVFVSYQ